MTTLTRTLPLIDGRPAPFESVDAAVAYYRELNMRVIEQTDDTITFGAEAIITQSEGKDGVRTWYDMFIANMTLPPPKPARTMPSNTGKRYYRTDQCTVCGGKREMPNRARCRDCYRAEKRNQYTKKVKS